MDVQQIDVHEGMDQHSPSRGLHARIRAMSSTCSEPIHTQAAMTQHTCNSDITHSMQHSSPCSTCSTSMHSARAHAPHTAHSSALHHAVSGIISHIHVGHILMFVSSLRSLSLSLPLSLSIPHAQSNNSGYDMHMHRHMD